MERRSSYILEKVFAFQDFSNWSSHMTFEAETRNIYALNENTLSVLRNDSRSIIAELTESSAAPLTKCCWYDKSKFYVTANSSGVLNCWSAGLQPLPKNVKAKADASGVCNAGGTQPTTCVLRHSLRPHTKAITGLAIHPITELVYTTGMDGFLKITNLETLAEVFSISMRVPITNFTLMHGSFGTDYLCVLGLQSGLIRVWTATSCSEVVTTLNSRLVHVCAHITPDHVKKERDKTHITRRLRRPQNAFEESSDNEEDAVLATVDKDMTEYMDEERMIEDDEDQERQDAESDVESLTSRPYTGQLSEVSGDAQLQTEDEELYLEGQANLQFTRNLKESGFFVSQTTHNMRIWDSKGKLVSIIGEDAIVDGVRSFAISLKHKMMYCLMEDRSLRIYALDRSPQSGPHRDDSDVPLRIIPGLNFGVVDFPCCIVIVDCIPNKSGAKTADMHSSDTKQEAGERNSVDDLRHDLMAVDNEETKVVHDESLVVGGSIGTFRWLDTAIGLREVAATEAATGSIGSLKYDASRNMLFAYASSMRDASAGTILAFSLPSITLLYVVDKLERVTYWNISMYHPYVGIGTSDGFLRLFHLLALKPKSKPLLVGINVGAPNIQPFSSKPSSPQLNISDDDAQEDVIIAAGDVFEVVLGDNISVNDSDTILLQPSSAMHLGPVTCVSFCDSLDCIATSSVDMTVRIWSLDKILLQSVKFDYPVESIFFSPYHGIGDIVVTQQTCALLLNAKVLDLDVLINAAALLKEDWLQATIPENVTEEDVLFLKFNKNNNPVHNSLKGPVNGIKPIEFPMMPSSRESHRGSRDFIMSGRPSSTNRRGSFSDNRKINKVTTMALNVRRPPTIDVRQCRSLRLSKQLPPPKTVLVDEAHISTESDTQQLIEKAEGNIMAEPLTPQAPDASAKPSSSGLRKRVAFRA